MQLALSLIPLLLNGGRFLGGIPVPDDLETQDAVDHGAAKVGGDDHLVAGLLDRGEDAGQGAECQQEHCDRRELSSVAVTEVCHDLKTRRKI